MALVPSSPAKWRDISDFNFKKARALTANILKECRNNEHAERASKDAGTEQAAREKQALRDDVFAKADKHGKVINTSSETMRSIEDGVLQTDNSLALLRQTRALAFAALQVNKRRTQLRNRRPKPELIKDNVTLALESEQKLLEAAREEFLQMEAEGKKISEELSNARSYLSQDTGSRRLVMKKDQQSLRPHLQPPPELQRPAPLVKEDETKALFEESFQLLDRSNRHRDKSLQIVARIKAESRSALTRVEDCLEKRTDELNVLERDLKKSMADCDAAIAVAEQSLSKSHKRLAPDDTEKKEKLARDGALLGQLKAHKEVIHTEIQNKFIALEIDNMCRRVTPVKACEPNLLDDQNGQTNKPGMLKSSSSAPNLVSNSGTMKLPNLAGTNDSFITTGRDKFGSTTSKFSPSPLSSAGSSSTFGKVKAKH